MRVTRVFLAFIMCSTLVCGQECFVSSRDDTKGVDAVVESCDGIGTYSLGGLYGGQWSKLSFNYPKPWKGSYATYKIDGALYCTSPDPRNCTLADNYVSTPPILDGGSITTNWLISGVSITQKIRLMENKTVLEYVFRNQDTINHSVGLRVHLDTMLGLNDGAPVYIPSDGLRTTEKTYGEPLDFGYFKAYNNPDQPTIVATGIFDPKEGMSSPSRVTVADWKKSKDHAWEYPTSELSITGDSAILLYYSPKDLAPGATETVNLGYGGGTPVLKAGENVGFAEIILDKITGKYCPNERVTFKVDVLSAGTDRTGTAYLIVDDGKTALTNQSKSMVFPKDEVKTLNYAWVLGEHGRDASYNVKAVLVNDTKVLDVYEKRGEIRVELDKCGNPIIEAGKKAGGGLLILVAYVLAILAFAAFVVFLAYLWMSRGEVEFTKYLDGEQVFVKVENKTMKTLKDVLIEDPLPENAEVKVQTIDVFRKGVGLRWFVGDLRPGKTATLEYWVRGGRAYGTSKLKWEGGEKSI